MVEVHGRCPELTCAATPSVCRRAMHAVVMCVPCHEAERLSIHLSICLVFLSLLVPSVSLSAQILTSLIKLDFIDPKDVTRLYGEVPGPPDSPFQGGTFKLEINIPPVRLLPVAPLLRPGVQNPTFITSALTHSSIPTCATVLPFQPTKGEVHYADLAPKY